MIRSRVYNFSAVLRMLINAMRKCPQLIIARVQEKPWVVALAWLRLRSSIALSLRARLTTWNQGWLTFLGVPLEDILGLALDTVHPRRRPRRICRQVARGPRNWRTVRS